MTKHKKKSYESRSVILLFLGLLSIAILLAILLKGTDVALLNPKGLIAGDQYSLMILSAAVLLLIAVPTLFLFYFIAWKYRETNENATYNPNTRHDNFFVFSMWAIPGVFFIVLSFLMWSSTHKLEPQKAIAANADPITIQVVAMPWKWLFIYPEQNIATVNYVQIPVNTPVRFELTADSVSMSSFWIPHLGGQLYAMTGHVNRLNLVADTTGDYPGSSAEINGSGFAGMKFMARVSSRDDFDIWTRSIQQSFTGLDGGQYEKLLQHSENHPYEYYSEPEANLYDKVVMKYSGSHEHTNTKTHGEHGGH